MPENTHTKNTEWKRVKEYPKYQVSNMGQVKHDENGLLNPYTIPSGHYFVCLSNNGKRRTVAVHNLVAEHFLGDRPLNHVVHHKGNNKSKNAATDLEYVSRKTHGRKHKDQNVKPFKAVREVASHLNNDGRPLCRPLREGYYLVDGIKYVTCLCCRKAMGVLRKGTFGALNYLNE